jgi:hypothetical protein
MNATIHEAETIGRIIWVLGAGVFGAVLVGGLITVGMGLRLGCNPQSVSVRTQQAATRAVWVRVIIEGGHDFHPRRSPVFIEGGHPFS